MTKVEITRNPLFSRLFPLSRLEAYLRKDRQWLRRHRIAHARACLAQATTAEGKAFWASVLACNLDVKD